jgi:hypothetical protein
LRRHINWFICQSVVDGKHSSVLGLLTLEVQQLFPKYLAVFFPYP